MQITYNTIRQTNTNVKHYIIEEFKNTKIINLCIKKSNTPDVINKK